MKQQQDIIEAKAGHCWRCGEPFKPGELITIVRRHFLFRGYHGAVMRSGDVMWGTMCPRCTTDHEFAEASWRVNCQGCEQPLATYPLGSSKMRMGSHRSMVCSDRCQQRWRRRRRVRPIILCEHCGEGFVPKRDDTRHCSNACRQASYRQRKNGRSLSGPARRPEIFDRVLYLENVLGVLHHDGQPIIAINDLHPGWSNFGNRYVCSASVISDAMRKAGCGNGYGYSLHLIECLECRRWAITDGLSFCVRKCRLAYRAAQARERRATSKS